MTDAPPVSPIAHIADDGAQLGGLFQPGTVSGRASGPVVMLHSLFFDATMFDAVRALLPAALQIFVPDHRAQATSEAGAEPPSIDRLARDVIDLLVSHDAPPSHFVGSSMGGYVALQVAALRPDLVRSLTLSCCTAHAERQRERFDVLEARIRNEGTDALGTTLVETMFGARFVEEDGPALAHWRERFISRGASVADAVHGVFARPGYEPLLPGLTMPLLLLSGELDRAKRPDDMAFVERRVPGSRHVVFARSGHTPPVETPELFAQELLAFWRGTPGFEL